MQKIKNIEEVFKFIENNIKEFFEINHLSNIINKYNRKELIGFFKDLIDKEMVFHLKAEELYS